VKRDELRPVRPTAIITAAPRIVQRPAVRIAAAVLATIVLLGLVILKAVTHPAWRASARSGAVGCLGGDDVPDRLHQVQRLGCVVARLEPIRADYVELAVALLLIVVLAGELRLLARDRDSSRRAAMLPRPTPTADRGDTSSRGRLPSPRPELASPSHPRAGSVRSGRSEGG
jgi:hypothetical protein